MENMEQNTPEPVLKLLFRYLKPYRFWIIVCVFASICNAFVDLYIAQLMQKLIDNTVNAAMQEVIRLVTTLGIIVGFGIIVKYLLRFSSGNFSAKTVRDIRKIAAEKLVHSKIADLEADHTGATVSKLSNNVNVIHGFLDNNLSGFIYLPIILIGTLVMMFIISWKLLVINLVLMAVTVLIVSLQSRPLEKYTEELQYYLGNINAVAQDLIRGMTIIKTFSLYHVLFRKFQLAVDQAQDKSLQIEKKISRIIPISSIFETLPLLVSIMVGGYLVISGEITPGSLIVNIYLLEFLSSSLSGLPQLFIGLNILTGASVELFAIINKPAERTGGETAGVDLTDTPIEFKGVSYAYNAESPLLNQLSFQMHKGETIALVGYSGSGKSTVLKLLCGFHEPSEGQIQLNGKPLSELDLNSVRSLMTLVSQDVFLFPASIRENIAYGKPNAAESEIKAAAKAANLEEFILKLPEGYDTIVGERGARLSGGEKQRISIARAILKNTPIMLLDEPTSSLDKESEALILEALNNLLSERTTLIVTHRLSGIKNVSKILILDKGSIVETGNHESLINSSSIYKRLYNNQVIERLTAPVSMNDEVIR